MDEVSSQCLLGFCRRLTARPPERCSASSSNPYWKGLGADSEEKHEPVSDIDTVVVDSLKALDPNGRLEKQTFVRGHGLIRFLPLPTDSCSTANQQIALLFDYLVRAGEQRRR
jgi:hypothetical protein